MFYQSFPSAGTFGAFLALKLSRSQRLLQGACAVHSQHLSLHVDGARRTPNIFLYDWRGTATITTASTPRATRRRGVRYARGPRRTLCSHDRQRAPRKLSVHAVVLCASCSPLYCPGASRPRQACSRLTSRFRVASYCRRVHLVCDKHGSTASAAAANTATTTIHSPTHRWLRQALRIQRCTARPLFTRPAWPRRALR